METRVVEGTERTDKLGGSEGYRVVMDMDARDLGRKTNIRRT